MMKGFTLIELLAVVVILSIILVITIPQINQVINNSKLSVFESNASLILDKISIYEISDKDIASINETNIEEKLEVDSDNFKSVEVTKKDNKYFITIIGKNKWDGLFVSGTKNDLEASKIPNSLIAYWNFNGNANDLSGNNYNGTISNQLLTDGIFGKCYEFNDSTNGINTTFNGTEYSNISFSIWANYKSTDENMRYIFDNSPGGRGYILRYSVNTLFFYKYNEGQPDITTSITNSPERNKWLNITITKDLQNLRMYINGVLIGERSDTTMITSSTRTLYIGSDIDNIMKFIGLIDNFQIYNKALAQSEVIRIYNGKLPLE